jgi:hypothetical protein
MNMTKTPHNKYRLAMDVLQRGRDQIVDELAEQVLDSGDDLLESPYLFNEMLEGQGTKLHFLGLLMAQLEQSAEQLEEAEARVEAAEAKPSAPAPRKRKSRAKKAIGQASPENEPGEKG